MTLHDPELHVDSTVFSKVSVSNRDRSPMALFIRYNFDIQVLSLFQAEQELRKECEKKCLQLQEVWRREGLVKADLELAKAQVGVAERKYYSVICTIASTRSISVGKNYL